MPDHHPTKRVHVGPWAADIDVLIAPLIRDIWKAGIETRQCCQSYAWLGVKGRRIWVQFPGSVELAKFLNAVTHDRDACGAQRSGQILVTSFAASTTAAVVT